MADPFVGLLITSLIVRITWQAWRTIRADPQQEAVLAGRCDGHVPFGVADAKPARAASGPGGVAEGGEQRPAGPEGPVRRTNPVSMLTSFYDKRYEANLPRAGKARKKMKKVRPQPNPSERGRNGSS